MVMIMITNISQSPDMILYCRQTKWYIHLLGMTTVGKNVSYSDNSAHRGREDFIWLALGNTENITFIWTK